LLSSSNKHCCISRRLLCATSGSLRSVHLKKKNFRFMHYFSSHLFIISVSRLEFRNYEVDCSKITGANSLFILHPQFLQFLEIWFEKSVSRNLFPEICFEKSVSRNLVPEIWFQKSVSRNLVPEIWFQKSGSRNLVPESWFQKSGSRKLVPDIWFQKSGSRNLVPEIWCQKSGARNLIQEIWFKESGYPFIV
jgi:hypothetical protein